MNNVKRISVKHTPHLARRRPSPARVSTPRISAPFTLGKFGAGAPHISATRFATTVQHFADGSTVKSPNVGIKTAPSHDGNGGIGNRPIQMTIRKDSTKTSTLYVTLSLLEYSEDVFGLLNRLNADGLLNNVDYRKAKLALSNTPRMVRGQIQVTARVPVIPKHLHLLRYLRRFDPSANKAVEYLERERVTKMQDPKLPDGRSISRVAADMGIAVLYYRPTKPSAALVELLSLRQRIDELDTATKTLPEFHEKVASLKAAFDEKVQTTYDDLAAAKIQDKTSTRAKRLITLVQLRLVKYGSEVAAAYALCSRAFDLLDNVERSQITPELPAVREEVERIFRKVSAMMRDAGLMRSDPSAPSIMSSNFGGGGGAGRSRAVPRSLTLSERDGDF